MTPDEVREELIGARQFVRMLGENQDTCFAACAIAEFVDKVRQSIDIGPTLVAAVAP